MKKLPVEEAVGQTLCHDMTAILPDGTKGPLFRRGQVITEADVAKMKDIGKFHVFVWDPAADEVHEEDAAKELVDAMLGQGLTASGPSEGKIQINAAVKGLFHLNREALRRINTVEDYTVATRPNFTPVEAGEKLCGARIVPLVTKRKNVDEAVAIARECFPVMEVLPYKPLKAGVVITGSEVYYGRIQDRFEPVMRAKLGGYGAELLGFTKCPDELEKIMAAVDAFLRQDADLILLTGGMSVDPDDLTPTAIRNTGAELIAAGIPMQPGNMLHIARLGKCTLFGVPGASLHSPYTSLDLFLPRLFAGLELTKADVADLGEGGFCLGCKPCHYPNCTFGRK